VLMPGVIAPGDDLEVVSRPRVAVTVAESLQAFYGDHDLMRRLLEVPGRSAKWDAIAADVLSRA
jgi:MOSC domain-containing protein YiiM